MSATLSEATGRPYGIQRVCQAWERSRSALYARQTREQQRHKGEEPARRGPTPTVSDATLLEAIQADLDRSPFQGEGHRKVHARLRILDGIRVARTRVLRVMRAHKLLSPHRGRQGTARVHAGTIVTQAPNVMWGTDGVRVFTLDDGWGWIFTAVEHWNAECVGWHVCKVGSRFAALEPIAQGLRRIYGALDADSARGLALRMDHGSQYLSDHFLNQIRYWGIRPSYGFVEEPETNGVAERWNRTLKEQATHGRIFQNLKEVRAAVTAFVERYNTTWRLEKLGYHTPIEARVMQATAARGADTSYAGRRSVNLCRQRTGCGDDHRERFTFHNGGGTINWLRNYLSGSVIQKSQVYNLVRDFGYRFFDRRIVSQQIATYRQSGSTDIPPEQEFYLDLFDFFVQDLSRRGVGVIMISVADQLDGFPHIRQKVDELHSSGLLRYTPTTEWFDDETALPSPEGHLWGREAHAIVGTELSKVVEQLHSP